MHRRLRLPSPLCWLLVAFSLVLRCAGQGTAAAPVDRRETVSEALCVVIQSLQDFQQAAASGDLEVIHTEELILHAALSVLLKEADVAVEAHRKDVGPSVTAFARLIAVLHLSAHAADLPKTRAEVALAAEAFESIEPFYDEAVRARARELATRYTCAMHASIEGRLHELCPRCGMRLDQRMRPSPFEPGNVRMPARTVKGLVERSGPFDPGQPATCRLHLSSVSNEPVALKDLRETHTQKIHLLIIDPLLSDYHHEHPVAAETPGTYHFSFTPQTAGPYRVWVDLRTVATGFQQYVPIDLGTFVPATISGPNVFTAQAGGLRFDLLFARKAHLKAGLPVNARVRVSHPDGRPFTQLEPIMAAFAHLVGFGDDGKTIVHLHPKGPPVEDPAARTGPELEFVFYSSTPGFVRLFAQVQVDGKSVFAPFSLNVHPRDMPDELCTPLPEKADEGRE